MLSINMERKIKIQPKYFPRAWKDVIFPEIRLAGKWLQDAGFSCGQFVTITQQGNSITITAVPQVQVQPANVKAYKREKGNSPNRTITSGKRRQGQSEGKIVDLDIRPSQVADGGAGGLR